MYNNRGNFLKNGGFNNHDRSHNLSNSSTEQYEYLSQFEKLHSQSGHRVHSNLTNKSIPTGGDQDHLELFSSQIKYKPKFFEAELVQKRYKVDILNIRYKITFTLGTTSNINCHITVSSVKFGTYSKKEGSEELITGKQEELLYIR